VACRDTESRWLRALPSAPATLDHSQDRTPSASAPEGFEWMGTALSAMRVQSEKPSFGGDEVVLRVSERAS